ncbi:spore coat protein SP96-like [Bactrocera neohumeralis]|uniref:spore coat protein SP96-like n=1 Tax=Bactrocera neohumeralis TaxID=98809 RepID=UPI0021652EBB|nr:spore coat protein SP96-like [Bactrocera neohumeralis]
MFYHVNSKRLLMVVLTNLLLITNEHFGHAALTGQCNECFASEAACLDEQNFAICVDGTQINVSTPCPTGMVCTANAAICQATAQGALPVCYEEQCGTCASAQKNFACLDEAIYAICYNGQTPDPSSIDYCPLGYVCDLTNPQICSSAQTVNPSCTIDDTTTDATTTDTTSDSTTETTTDSTTDTTTDTTADSTTDTTTDSTTDTTTATTTDTTTDTTTESTTESTTDTTTDTTTDSTTDTTTATTTDTTTDATTDTTTDSTTDTTTDSTTDKTTETSTATTTGTTTTDTTTHTTTDTTTESTTESTTRTTTVSTTVSTQAPVDANTFCAEKAQTGKFRQEGDTTCARYIYCYRLSGQYLGYQYTCQYYFNAATQACQTVRPDDC